MLYLMLVALSIAVIAAAPQSRPSDRIMGGSDASAGQYPSAVALLLGSGNSYQQACGGAIINTRSVLTACHCFDEHKNAIQWRSRVGSIHSNSGGVVHNTQSIIPHKRYSRFTNNFDFAIVRLSTVISFNANVQPGNIASASHAVADNAELTAIGWGQKRASGPLTETLQHVKVWAVNQKTCTDNYETVRRVVTKDMLCAGYINVGGRDQCPGDSGSPLFHGDVIVGVCSFGHDCGLPNFPGVNARVSSASAWIGSNT